MKGAHMREFTITVRTEPFTLEEVCEFIDDTSIGKLDAHELKSRIADVIQAERNKVIDDFAEKIIYICENNAIGYDRNKNRPLYANADGIWCDLIKDVRREMKEGAE